MKGKFITKETFMKIINQKILLCCSYKRTHFKILSQESLIEVNLAEHMDMSSFACSGRGGFHSPQTEKSFKSVGNFHFSEITILSKCQNKIYFRNMTSREIFFSAEKHTSILEFYRLH